ncbi:hypothetical protein V495_04869 [Pseudogymnoascus sp. VKM F-4514 (FW-929)]|nr:hypothetical protein V495_04869 [Pseudogymnoascus sp. VKM F-4514 (FW-929)]KFY51676.1 hypothetical protein V497_08937 [Pseudogymnoascus sp. VKM F-4516 (FW-969)]
MSLNSVLLTGGTGSLGASVLAQLLSKGHSVTAVVRSIKKSAPFLNKQYASQVESGKLKLVEVPDMTVPNAFDDLVKTVDAIVHVATPLSDRDFEKTVINATFAINDNIFAASLKAPSVKRIVITGSIVSTMSLPDTLFQPITVSADDFSPITKEQGLSGIMPAYQYAKTASEKKAWEFIKTTKPSFDLVVLLAPSITGKCIQEGFTPSKTALGGMADIYKNVFDVETPGPVFPFVMDVEDVASIHVKSLDLKVPGNERYLFHSGHPQDSAEIAKKVREEYPQLRSRVPEVSQERAESPVKVKVDTAKSDKVFPGPWKGWWESAKDTVDDIVKFEK